MRGPAAILLFLILLAACGDDNPVDSGPVAPDPTLVGSWAFDSTDMVAVMAAGIADLMRDLGADQDDIAILHELRDMRIALQVGASDRSPLQFGVCLRSSENYLVNDLGWLYRCGHRRVSCCCGSW